MRLTKHHYLRSNPTASMRSGVALCGCLAFSACAAATDGNELLRSLDASLKPAAILSLDYAVVTKKPEVWRGDFSESAVRIKALIHEDKRLYEFVAPSDISGTKLLNLSPEQCYVYLPTFGKVRRIPAKPDSESFLGLSFSVADLGGTPLSTQYIAKITKEETEAMSVLELTPKPDRPAPYARIELTVTKDMSENSHPLLSIKLEYFDKQNSKIKTEIRIDYRSIGDSKVPAQIRMTDHRPEGGTTTFHLLEGEILTELPPETFTTKGLLPVLVND